MALTFACVIHNFTLQLNRNKSVGSISAILLCVILIANNSLEMIARESSTCSQCSTFVFCNLTQLSNILAHQSDPYLSSQLEGAGQLSIVAICAALLLVAHQRVSTSRLAPFMSDDIFCDRCQCCFLHPVCSDWPLDCVVHTANCRLQTTCTQITFTFIHSMPRAIRCIDAPIWTVCHNAVTSWPLACLYTLAIHTFPFWSFPLSSTSILSEHIYRHLSMANTYFIS